MTKKIKAIIFDMDGVLIDAKDWHYEALNRALGKFGFAISRHDHLVTFDGLPTRDKLEMLSAQDGLSRNLHKLLNELKQKYTMELVHSKCAPTFIHQYALSKFKKEGYKIAVASNSIRNTITVMMEAAELNEYLDFYLSNEDVTKGKPDPEIYTTAIERLGLKPLECLIIEDNPNGLKAANASGANVMHVQCVTDVNYENISYKIHELEASL
jgi:beta-phosphoglucomutase-like phosphatase (HAD superfamily)